MKLVLGLLVAVVTLFSCSSNKGADHQTIIGSAAILPSAQVINHILSDLKKDLFDTPLKQKISHASLHNFTPTNPDETSITWRAHVNRQDQIIHIKDKTTGNPIATIVHNKAIQATSFNLKQKLMALANDDNSVDIFDLNNAQLLCSLPHTNKIKSIQFNLEGTQLLAQEACNLESYADIAFPNINFPSIAHLWHLPISHTYDTYLNSLTPAQAARIYFTWQNIVQAQPETIPNEILARLQLLAKQK